MAGDFPSSMTPDQIRAFDAVYSELNWNPFADSSAIDKVRSSMLPEEAADFNARKIHSYEIRKERTLIAAILMSGVAADVNVCTHAHVDGMMQRSLDIADALIAKARERQHQENCAVVDKFRPKEGE